MNTKQTYVMGGVILILVVIGGMMLFGRNLDIPAKDVAEDIEPTDTRRNDVIVESQPAGSIVNVKEVTLDDRLWVVVYEEREGMRGNILGAKRLPEGTHQNTYVSLLRNTEAGNRYHIVIHSDNGDDVFDFTQDTPLENISYTFFAR